MSRRDRSRPGVGGLPHPLESMKRLRERKPLDPWADAANQEHVKAGRICGRCLEFVDKKKGQEELRRDEFWDRLFHAHDDGTDFKPHHVGDPNCYSICRKTSTACHELAPACGDFKA